MTVMGMAGGFRVKRGFGRLEDLEERRGWWNGAARED